MEAQSIASWVQGITGFSILLGIGLVVWELRQTKDLAEAQMYHEAIAQSLSVRAVTISERFGEVRAKACFRPDELTDGELYEMYEFHSMLMHTVNRLRLVKDVGNFEYSWEDLAKPNMKTYLSTSVGLADFEATKTHFAPETRKLAVSMLSNNEIESCENMMGQFFELSRKGRG